jgi:hypothetical protein
MIQATCACGEVATAREELAGRTVRCRKCGGRIVFPASAQDPFALDLGSSSPLRDIEPLQPVAATRRRHPIFEWPLVLLWLIPLSVCCLLPFVIVLPFERGLTGTLGDGAVGEGQPLLFDSPQSHREFFEAQMYREEDPDYGLRVRDKMVEEGRAYWADRQAPVRVLRRRGLLYEVEVLGGSSAGKRGWIMLAWVKNQNGEMPPDEEQERPAPPAR